MDTPEARAAEERRVRKLEAELVTLRRRIVRAEIEREYPGSEDIVALLEDTMTPSEMREYLARVEAYVEAHRPAPIPVPPDDEDWD